VQQAAVVVAALIYLLASGKLATPKDDWAANVVFLAGGVTILLISLVSLQTYRRTIAA
jgi:NADH:ubiquinone oxidoreductase subunit 5 (subunit L)/multisubunit Na+/H+ antiporter MnhA subunit